MPMRILTTLAFLSLPTLASAQDYIVNLDEGLWNIKSSVSAEGRGVLISHDDNHCLAAHETKKTLQDLLSETVEGGQCEITNVVQSTGSAKADGTCYDPEMETRTQGTLEGTWSSTSYDVKGRATVVGTGGMVTLTSKTTARRIGDCE